MICSILNVKINSSVSDILTSVKITDGNPILTWEPNFVTRVIPSVGDPSFSSAIPYSYEIRIGTSQLNIGNDLFSGDIVNTGEIISNECSWRYNGSKLSRGNIYYGQIRISDSLLNSSDWYSFVFSFNRLPVVSDVILSQQGTGTSDLILDYTFTDDDSDFENGSKIWWYKNGIREKQFDNLLRIKSRFIHFKDVWYAVVIPSDGFEFGASVTSNSITILTETPIVSNMMILPENPTTSDPLYAKYDINSISDNSVIRWYINNDLIENSSSFLRYDFSPGDTVRFEIQPSDGISNGAFVSSNTVVISNQPYIIKDLTINNENNPLHVMNLSPTISWNVIGYNGEKPSKTYIKIGTTPDSSNVYEAEINSYITSYTIPNTILNSGIDYYVTVSAGNNDGYGESSYIHFRTYGSRWKDNVDNSIGWTIESTFKINSGYQGFRVYDGTKYAEVRFFENKMQFISNEMIEIDNNFNSFSTVTISGKNSDIYVYKDHKMIFDGTGLLLQTTTDKFIEFGSINSTGDSSADYLNIYYTTQYNFIPTDYTYNTLSFSDFYEIDGTIDCITSANGEIYFSATPNELNSSSVIYKISDYKNKIISKTVNKTFTPINKIKQSPNEKYTYLCHGRGLTVFNGYAIGQYDSSIDFTTDDSIYNSDWEFIYSSDNTSFNNDGLYVNTSYGGKSYLAQRKHGSKWFDNVSNVSGWTVNLDLQVNNVINSLSADDDNITGYGIFISDGNYYETIYFLKDSIYFENAKTNIPYDTSILSSYTITGKNNNLQLYINNSFYTDITLVNRSTKEGNAGFSSICEDSNGEQHSVWDDDGEKILTIYYSYTKNGVWQSPKQIINEKFGSLKPSIASYDDKIYIVYESYKNDLSDIGMIIKNSNGWGEPFILSSGSGVSKNPKITTNSNGDIFVVWEDNRNGQSQIFYKYYLNSVKKWSSDVQITTSDYGCFNPSISFGSILCLTYTEKLLNGKSRIILLGNDGDWNLQTVLSDIYDYADFSDVVFANDGYIYVVWHDIDENYIYQIYGKSLNPSFITVNSQKKLTNLNSPSKYPKIGYRGGEDDLTGNIYVVYEYLENETTSFIKSLYFDKNIRNWLSENQQTSNDDGIFGGYSVLFMPFDIRSSHRPSIPKFFIANTHVLYKSDTTSYSEYEYNEYQHANLAFSIVKSVIYNLSYTNTYLIGRDIDLQVSGVGIRKEIRIGDFSDNVSGQYLIKNIKIYTKDAVSPFGISILSKNTSSLPSDRILSVFPNNNGDVWIGTDKGLSFYSNKLNQFLSIISSDLVGKSIRCIDVDKNGFMIVGTGDGLIYISYDHINFYELSFNGITITSPITSVAIDNENKLWIGTLSNGLYVADIESSIFPMEDGPTTAPQPISGVISYTTETSFPSNCIYNISVDSFNVKWICTNNGLVSIFKNYIKVFNVSNGLPSNIVNDISIVNSSLRYIATSNGIAKMTGVLIVPVNIEHSEWNGNIKSICWKNPNTIFVGSMSNLFQITDEYNIFTPYVYNPSSYTLETTSYDDLKTYYIIDVDTSSILDNTLCEVLVNKRIIKYGFTISQKDGYWAISFLEPLNRNDVVEVIIRNDISIYANLAQNKAEQLANGNISKTISKFITNGVNLYSIVNDNSLFKLDYTISYTHPYSKIGLDTTPPTGKITFNGQVDRRNVNLLIESSDNLSGVDSMRVSNYPNFTYDGTIELPWVPFESSVTHDLGLDLGLLSSELDFNGTYGKNILLFNNNDINTLYAFSSTPINIYSYNGTGSWDFITSIDNGNTNIKCMFSIVYKDKLIIGTGEPGGSGKIYISIDGQNFNLLSSVDGEYAYCATILNDILYIGSGDNGKIYAYDGVSIREVYNGLGSNIYSIYGYDGKIYAATGEQGRLYSWNPLTNVTLILYVDIDTQLNSVLGIFIESKTSSSSSSTSKIGDNVLFIGTNNTSKILKSVNKNAFTTSFNTISGYSVKYIKIFNEKIYAAINNTLYYYNGETWLAKKSIPNIIEDFYIDENDNIWIISQEYIYKLRNDITNKNIYLQLKDRAGNETVQNNPNLMTSIKISDLQSFTHKNRILEIDEYGLPVFTYDGDSSFYSAERITVERGIYLSEVFNGSNDHVSWGEIYWDSIVPDGTDATISVRSSRTRSGIISEQWTEYPNAMRNGVDISSYSGQFIQFKINLSSTVRGLSPSVYKVVITSTIRNSVHYFTTNFILPGKITKGIITSSSIIPITADIVFGINTTDSTDFSDYQIIENNKIFSVNNNVNTGKNLRIGVKLISPIQQVFDTDKYPQSDPLYGDLSYVNVIDFNYTGPSSKYYNFKIEFYSNYNRTLLVDTVSTLNSVDGWSYNNTTLDENGIYIQNGETVNIISTAKNLNTLRCNEYYYLKIYVWDGSSYALLDSSRSFIIGCNTTDVDIVRFNYTNTSGYIQNSHFRVRIYSNIERTTLLSTYFSNYDNTGWVCNDNIIPTEGISINNNETVNVEFIPDLSLLSYNSIYYLSIDMYNGVNYTTLYQNKTFRMSQISSEYCGEYSNVPILKNFAIMFEMEDGATVMLNI